VCFHATFMVSHRMAYLSELMHEKHFTVIFAFFRDSRRVAEKTRREEKPTIRDQW
jgi:hypothetical protein